jgi:endonuclease YncB( thermonuclease family)
MSFDPRCRRAAWIAVFVAAALGAARADADEWLVYLDGALVPIEGGWSEQRGRVVFTRPGGTLTSVRFSDVDLAASTFINWQLSGRREVPPRATLAELQPPPAGSSPPTCAAARVARLLGGESLEVEIGGEREIVHLACLDTPETQQKLPALGWFGRVAIDAIETEIRPGTDVCLTEQVPERRDAEGHPIVYVKLADGRDLALEIVAGGYGLLRPPECRDGARYRAAEDLAIESERGLWALSAAPHAFDAARLGAVALPRGNRGGMPRGCRLRR